MPRDEFSEFEIREIPVDEVVCDRAWQARETTNDLVVNEYLEAWKAGAEFPPIDVFEDSDGTFRCADGHQRAKSAAMARRKSIQARVRSGGVDECLLFAVGANASHGVRRSNSDKRRAVRLLLKHPKWSSYSNKEIARRARVSDTFVSAMRRECLEPAAHGPRKAVFPNGETRIFNPPVSQSQSPSPGLLCSFPAESTSSSTSVASKPTVSSDFLSFVRSLRSRGLNPDTHVKSTLGITCITTRKNVYIVESSCDERSFCLAMARAQLACVTIDAKLKPVVVSRRTEEMQPWIEAASLCGVAFIEIDN